jgi:hypothetical protein
VTESRETAAGSLAATGGRLVRNLQHGSLVHAQDRARYLIAAQLARDRRVLDAARVSDPFIYGSTSWRLTVLLRRAATVLRGRRG